MRRGIISISISIWSHARHRGIHGILSTFSTAIRSITLNIHRHISSHLHTAVDRFRLRLSYRYRIHEIQRLRKSNNGGLLFSVPTMSFALKYFFNKQNIFVGQDKKLRYIKYKVFYKTITFLFQLNIAHIAVFYYPW